MVILLRQGLIVTVKQLEKIARDLRRQENQLEHETGIKNTGKNQFMINIINKQKKCSDTWELEW